MVTTIIDELAGTIRDVTITLDVNTAGHGVLTVTRPRVGVTSITRRTPWTIDEADQAAAHLRDAHGDHDRAYKLLVANGLAR